MNTLRKLVYTFSLFCIISVSATAGDVKVENEWQIKAEINELVNAYGIHRDDGNAVGYADTFAEDGVLIIHGESYKGREVLRKRVENGSTSNVNMHIITTGLITLIDNNNATGVHYSTIYRSPKGEDYKVGTAVPLKGITSVAKYFDKYIRTDEGWKFAERKSVPAFTAAK